MKKAVLLAAGEGLRLRSLSPFKPIVKINGTPLMQLTYTNLGMDRFNDLCIIFNDDHRSMDMSELSLLKRPGVYFFFKTTKSSMHSLFEVAQKIGTQKGEHLFCSMVDSIVLPEEAELFLEFTDTLKKDESAIMITSHIEDEKPLTVTTDKDGLVISFGAPLSSASLVTSGVYCFSYQALEHLGPCIDKGMIHMRNFLNELLNCKEKIRTFKVEKTLDIDRPEDIKSAEHFLLQKKPLL